MRPIQVSQLDYDLTPTAGLALVGHFLKTRGQTVHETCLRQDVDLWGFMHKAVYAFIAKAAPPSLLPRAAVPTG